MSDEQEFTVVLLGTSFGLRRLNGEIVYSGFHTRYAAEIVAKQFNHLEAEVARLTQKLEQRCSCRFVDKALNPAKTVLRG